MIGILPCPFCGSDTPELMDAVGEVWVRCPACLASTAAASSGPKQAIDNWNSRVTPSQAKEPKAQAGSAVTTPDRPAGSSRPVAGRSATATSELMDVTAGRDPRTPDHVLKTAAMALKDEGYLQLSEDIQRLRTSYKIAIALSKVRDEMEQHFERQDRIDIAIAKQLGDAVAEVGRLNAALTKIDGVIGHWERTPIAPGAAEFREIWYIARDALRLS